LKIPKERTEAGKKQIKEMLERMAEQGRKPRRPTDPDYEYVPAPEGEYTFVLAVGDRKFTKTASLLPDHWYNR
jgi:hypothetical protein